MPANYKGYFESLVPGSLAACCRALVRSADYHRKVGHSNRLELLINFKGCQIDLNMSALCYIKIRLVTCIDNPHESNGEKDKQAQLRSADML